MALKKNKTTRTYNQSLTAMELERLKHRCFAKNTDRKSRWGVTAYTEWRDAIIEEKGAEFIETFILKSNLLKPKELVQEDFCMAMCNFVTKVQKHNNKDYPSHSKVWFWLYIFFYIPIESIGNCFQNRVVPL